MKGHNICAWLKVGETEICGISCVQEYCKVHLAKIRKGSKIPVPCRLCGCAVQSEIPLCRGPRSQSSINHRRCLNKRNHCRYIFANVWVSQHLILWGYLVIVCSWYFFSFRLLHKSFYYKCFLLRQKRRSKQFGFSMMTVLQHKHIILSGLIHMYLGYC